MWLITSDQRGREERRASAGGDTQDCQEEEQIWEGKDQQVKRRILGR